MAARRRHRLSPCPGCGTPSAGAWCPACDPWPARRRARQHEHGRDTPEWRALSRARRTLAGCCELALDDRCTGRPETAHLDPALGGDHRRATLDDVRAACRHCHGIADAPRGSPRSLYY